MKKIDEKEKMNLKCVKIKIVLFEKKFEIKKIFSKSLFDQIRKNFTCFLPFVNSQNI